MIFLNNTFKKRIDELGRIVIPKQIRNTFKIKNFDELELYMEDDYIVLKKTGGILLQKEVLDNFLNFLRDYLFINAIIVDKNIVVSSSIRDIETCNTLIIDINKYINNSDKLDLEIIDGLKLSGFVRSFHLINDSNLYGDIVFILNDSLNNKLDLLKSIVKIILDLIS